MSGQSRPSACVVLMALLASLVAIASQVDAGSLRTIFNRHDKSYEQIANDLFNLMPSSELQDYVDAAGTLYSKSGMKKYNGSHRDLLFALGAQEDTDDEEKLCGGLKSLRVLAEAMAASGNLEPQKMTEPVRGLNRIIIKQIVKARAVCFSYLARHWPNAWSTPKEWPNVFKVLQEIDSLPRLLLLDSQTNSKTKEIETNKHLSLSCYLLDGREEKRLLMPYMNLLIASHIVEPESNKLAKFYQDHKEMPILEPVDHPNRELLDNAYRFRACELMKD